MCFKSKKNDKIYDVGAKVVIKAGKDLIKLLKMDKKKWNYINQKKSVNFF